MRVKPTLVWIAIAISMFLVACAAPAQPDSYAWVEVSCDEFYDNHHLTGAIEVQEGEMFTVTLCSNPSTGFEWSEEAQITSLAVLKQEEHTFISPESDSPPPPGTPGQEVWTFQALKQGSSAVSLEYSQPWGGGEKG